MSNSQNISKDWLQAEFTSIRRQLMDFEKKSDERHTETRVMVANNGQRITLLETWKNNVVGKISVIAVAVGGAASFFWKWFITLLPSTH